MACGTVGNHFKGRPLLGNGLVWQRSARFELWLEIVRISSEPALQLLTGVQFIRRHAGLTAVKTGIRGMQDKLYPGLWRGTLHTGLWHIGPYGEVTAKVEEFDGSKDAHYFQMRFSLRH